MRNAFAQAVTELAPSDTRVVLLVGDIGNRLFDEFKLVAPERFLNCGVAEANMMGVAAGLALSGLRPVVYTITPFTTTRCFEQIRVDVCYQEAPVIIVGTGSGFSYAKLGPTHHSAEDMAIMRTLPGMQVIAPCDAIEVRLALRAALSQDNPTYIRIGKKGEPAIHMADPTFEIGSAIVLRDGTDVALIATGVVVNEALRAAELLAEKGISAQVVSMHTVKPIDANYLASAATQFKLLVTIEEHGAIGGLGGAVAEWRSAKSISTPHLVLGAPDQFMHEIGSRDYMIDQFGLSEAGITASVSEALGR